MRNDCIEEKSNYCALGIGNDGCWWFSNLPYAKIAFLLMKFYAGVNVISGKLIIDKELHEWRQ